MFGCAGPLPVGNFYTGVTLPSAASSLARGSKKGVSHATSILGLVATRDTSIQAAKAAGGITKVSQVDFYTSSLSTVRESY